MQLQGEYTKMSSRLPSVSMMRGGALDVDPFLISRNTLGNGKTTTQNLKDKYQMVVAAMPWLLRKWNDGLYTMSELKSRSLSSRNTLGDTSHNSNKLTQNLVKLGWLCIVGYAMRKWWWWLMKKQWSLSSLNTLGDSNHYSSNHKCYGGQNG